MATRQFAVSAASFGLAGGARWTPPSGTGREEQSDESSASDEEWDPESWDDRLLGEGEARATMAAGDGVVRGRVRRHWISQARPGLAADDTRRKCLAEKGWARRSVVVHGVAPSGASNMEELPGREEFGVGNAGALQWMEAALDFAQENFNDAGAEERTLDQRDCKVGLFGERVGHGKLLHWVPKEEYGGLYALEPIKQVNGVSVAASRAARADVLFASNVAGDGARRRRGGHGASGAELGGNHGVLGEAGDWAPDNAKGWHP